MKETSRMVITKIRSFFVQVPTLHTIKFTFLSPRHVSLGETGGGGGGGSVALVTRFKLLRALP